MLRSKFFIPILLAIAIISVYGYIRFLKPAAIDVSKYILPSKPSALISLEEKNGERTGDDFASVSVFRYFSKTGFERLDMIEINKNQSQRLYKFTDFDGKWVSDSPNNDSSFDFYFERAQKGDPIEGTSDDLGNVKSKSLKVLVKLHFPFKPPLMKRGFEDCIKVEQIKDEDGLTKGSYEIYCKGVGKVFSHLAGDPSDISLYRIVPLNPNGDTDIEIAAPPHHST